METKDFLGAGMKFPPAVNPGTGRFMIARAEQSIKESVYIILMTGIGERWLCPSFGSRLLSYAFMDTSVTMLSLLANEIRSTLLNQEPRIADVTVSVDNAVKDECLLINIGYTVAAINQKDNMVFPFYFHAVGGEGFKDGMQNR